MSETFFFLYLEPTSKWIDHRYQDEEACVRVPREYDACGSVGPTIMKKCMSVSSVDHYLSKRTSISIRSKASISSILISLSEMTDSLIWSLEDPYSTNFFSFFFSFKVATSHYIWDPTPTQVRKENHLHSPHRRENQFENWRDG